MKKRNWITYALFALIALGVYFANVEIQTYLGKKVLDQSGLEINELDTALARAAKESKMVLADLSAIWCPTCRKIDELVLSDPEVRKVIEEKFVFARIEYESDEGEAFQKRYQVSGFPNLLILNPDGQKIRHLALTLKPAEFISQLSL